MFLKVTSKSIFLESTQPGMLLPGLQVRSSDMNYMFVLLRTFVTLDSKLTSTQKNHSGYIKVGASTRK